MNGGLVPVRLGFWIASPALLVVNAAASPGAARPTGALALDPVHASNIAAALTQDSPSATKLPHHPALSDRFWFGVGGFWSSSTTEARLDSPSGIGTTVDFEDVLGLEETYLSPQGLARWRMSERWRLELEFFQVDRSHTRATTDDIVWGDETFPAGTQLTTEFNVSVTRLSAGYSFFKTEDKEVGVGLGFHLTDVDASISSSGGADEGGAVLAPLPVVSFYGQFALTDTWALDGRLDAFKLEYEPYEGRVFSLGVDALYQPWSHVGFGFGWRTLHFALSAEGSDWEGTVGANFQGPIAFITVSF